MHEVAHLRPEDTLHRTLFRCHNMDFEVARAKRGRDFQADEAGAQDDSPAGRLRTIDNRPAVGERAQRMDMVLVGARDRQSDRFGARCQEQAVVRYLLSIGQPHFARLCVNGGDIRLEPEVDSVLWIEAGRTQRYPLLGRLPCQIVLG